MLRGTLVVGSAVIAFNARVCGGGPEPDAAHGARDINGSGRLPRTGLNLFHQ